MKLVAAIVTCAMFVFGVISQRTTVAPVSTVVIPMTTAAPVATTVIEATTTTVALPPTSSTTTILETWMTSTTTTTVAIVIASIETPVISELERMLCDPKWEWDCAEAKAVAYCESRMNPNAVSKPNTNGTIDRGLMQINSVWQEAWHPDVWARILDPEVNIAMAHHAWKVGNRSWKYWTCQP